jgi:hypothetical protein
LLIAVSPPRKNSTLDSPAGRPPWSSILQFGSRAGQVAMGIYFVHLLFVKTGETLAAKAFLGEFIVVDLSLFIAASILSIAVALMLSRWKSTRWLVA